MTEPSLRDRLRALPVFGEGLPRFDADAAPRDPLSLFLEWLDTAISADVLQPHAMTIATAGETGPAARTLLLKDVTADGFWFSSLTSSPKGRDLAADPRCALVLYWRELGRQVRVTGVARPGPAEVSAADFRQRHPEARAAAIAAEQSASLPAAAEVEERLGAARSMLAADPEYAPAEWVSYVVVPDTVEFWQASAGREVTRLRYRRDAESWRRELLWP